MNSLEQVNNFFNQAQVFYLTTEDGEKPKCRPISFHMIANNNIYFGVGDFKEVYKQLQKNPNVELCAVVQSEFLRFYGKAIFEADYTIANTVLEERPAMQKIYNEQTGYKLAIFHLKNATAEFRNVMGIKESYIFE